jgi:pimeloyl-ACP methyl ester carboxylesterase
VRNVMFLPGIIAPAAIRYEALIACLPDVNALPKDLEVYASDAPPPDYSIALEVAGVDRAADKAGFKGFHLYGHSGGGAVALAYAAARPERLLSLAVDEPASDFTQEAHADLEEFRPLGRWPYPSGCRHSWSSRCHQRSSCPLHRRGHPPPGWRFVLQASTHSWLHWSAMSDSRIGMRPSDRPCSTHGEA